MITAAAINQILAPLVLLGQIGLVSFAVYFFVLKKRNPKIVSLLKKYAIFLAFLVAASATLGSLVYSEVIGFEPCLLCWYQRVFMYPLGLMLWLAMYKKEKVIVDYVLSLSVVGAVIAAYHYLIQIGAAPEVACSAVGYSVSCAENFVMQLGYITIPMMSLTAFLAIAILMTALRKL
jgi:disulfide bond formation protein DsbB